MSELGFLFFNEEIDPVEKAQKTAKAVEAVRNELTERGIIAFVMNADSLPEAEQRLAMREVNAAIDDVVERYMPEDEEAKARLVSSIFKQFEAEKEDKMPMKDGRPAFVSEEEAEEAEEDSDSDEDDEDDEDLDDDSDDDDDDDDSDDDDDKSSKKEGKLNLAADVSRSCSRGDHDCGGCECDCHASEGRPVTNDDVEFTSEGELRSLQSAGDGLYDQMDFEQ